MNDHRNIRSHVLRRKQVEEVTGLSRSTIYLRVAQGTFPRAISLGVRAVGWLDTEVQDWLAEQIARSRETAS